MKLFSRLLQSSRPILKRWLYPLIWIVSLIFLGLAFAKHWQEVRAMRIGAKGGAGLAIATGGDFAGPHLGGLGLGLDFSGAGTARQ